MKRWAVVVLGVVFAVAISGCATETTRPKADLEKASKLNAELGLAYMTQGRNEWAMTKLKRALKENPDNGEAHHYIAELYRRLGEMDKAETHFKEALDRMPHDTPLLNNYGVFLCDEKKFDEADRYFQKVLKDPLNDDRAQTYENLGLCAQRAKQPERAEKYLHKALRMDKKRPKSLFSIAQIEYAKGHYRSARHYYHRYLDIAKKQNPQSLLLGIQIENQLGNQDSVASYELLLKGKYGDSPEADRLRAMEAQGQLP